LDRKMPERSPTRESACLYDSYVGLYTPEQMAGVGRHLHAELDRALPLLRRPGHPRVCFLSYLFRNERRESLRARLGAVVAHDIDARAHVFCDLRVGNARYDQVARGGLDDNSDEDESFRYIGMPSEVNEDAYRMAIWRLTEARYREAVECYYERKSEELHYVDEARGFASRARGEPVRTGRLQRFSTPTTGATCCAAPRRCCATAPTSRSRSSSSRPGTRSSAS
jgi:hypothetical protein